MTVLDEKIPPANLTGGAMPEMVDRGGRERLTLPEKRG